MQAWAGWDLSIYSWMALLRPLRLQRLQRLGKLLSKFRYNFIEQISSKIGFERQFWPYFDRGSAAKSPFNSELIFLALPKPALRSGRTLSITSFFPLSTTLYAYYSWFGLDKWDHGGWRCRYHCYRKSTVQDWQNGRHSSSCTFFSFLLMKT